MVTRNGTWPEISINRRGENRYGTTIPVCASQAVSVSQPLYGKALLGAVYAGRAVCYRQLGQFHLEKNYLLTTYYAVLEAGEFVRGDQSAIYREVISRALEKISEASLASSGLPGSDPTQHHVLSRAMH